jgi:exodeoxyribonuclease VII small subunit
VQNLPIRLDGAQQRCEKIAGFESPILFVRCRAIMGITTMSAKAKPEASSIDTLSFEAALKELEGIVARLEQGQVDLEDSIALYERGQALKAHCEKKLKAAESRLEKIVLGADGPSGAQAADLD